MGKVLIIKGADFSTNKIEQITLGVEAPVISISLEGLVTISSDYTVYYTTDGTTPTTSSTQYSGTFSVEDGTVIKAIAYYSGISSDVASQTASVVTSDFTPNKCVTSQGNVEDFTGFCCSGYIRVTPNTTYTIHCASGYNSSIDGGRYCTVEFNEDKSRVKDFWNHQAAVRQFTATASTYWIRTTFKMGVTGQYIEDASGNKIIEYDGE